MINYTSILSDSISWTWNEDLNGWETSSITESSFNNPGNDYIPYLSVQYLEYFKYRFDNINHKKLCPGTYTFNPDNGNMVINFNSYDLLKFKYYQDPSTASLVIITSYNPKGQVAAPSTYDEGQRIVKIINRSYSNTHFQIVAGDEYVIPVITFKDKPVFTISLELTANQVLTILTDGPIYSEVYLSNEGSGGGGGGDEGTALYIESSDSEDGTPLDLQ